jgi:hypothetical protein
MLASRIQSERGIIQEESFKEYGGCTRGWLANVAISSSVREILEQRNPDRGHRGGAILEANRRDRLGSIVAGHQLPGTYT